MTLNYNIWVNLQNYNNGIFYPLGTKVNNGGNAYIVVQPGTSANTGSGPTGTGQSIIDNNILWQYLSNVDYTGPTGDIALINGVGGLPSTFTQNVNWYIWNNGPIYTSSVGTVFLTLVGHTIAPYYLTIQPAKNNSIRDTLKTGKSTFSFNANNGVSFILPNSGAGQTNYFNILDNNVILSGLQFQDPNPISNTTIINLGGSNNSMQYCIVDGYSQTSGYSPLTGQGNNTTIINSLFVDRVSTSGGSGITKINLSGSSSNIVNCLLISTNKTNGNSTALTVSSGILNNTYNSMYFSYGNTTFSTTTGSINSSNCMFDNPIFPTGGGTNNGGNLFNINTVNQFNNIVNDFRTKLTSNAINKGLTETTFIPNNDDIAYTHRISWDIGPWQYKIPIHMNQIIFKTFGV